MEVYSAQAVSFSSKPMPSNVICSPVVVTGPIKSPILVGMVGASVVTRDGVEVGVIDGTEDGFSEGSDEGFVDGIAEGKSENVSVGATDGTIVSATVLIDVAPALGENVGGERAVGAPVLD